MTEQQTNIPVTAGEQIPPATAWHPLESLRKEVDRLFEDFDWHLLRSPFRRPVFDFDAFRRHTSGLSTTVDLIEQEKAYEVMAELPGLTPADVRVEVVGDSLRLAGEKRDERASTPAAGYHLRERHFGAFARSFVLPEDVDRDQISARFEQGVLTVTLPRRPDSSRAARKIEVKAS